MKVHHLNCATMCPPSARLVNGEGSLFARGRMVCHCLLIETDAGLVLVDTALGTGDVENPNRLGRPFVGFVHPVLRREETALAQVEALGFKREDVRHILVTHLDVDHAGGLGDFPSAKVHIYRDEYKAALNPANYQERTRYIQAQWAHGPDWVTYETGGELWHGFAAVRDLQGLPPEILYVPTVGHTRGHCAVAVQTPEGWLLHCGDAYFYHGEMEAHPHCTPGLAFFQRVIAHKNEARLRNQRRLRELADSHREDIRLFSAHDPVELDRLVRA